MKKLKIFALILLSVIYTVTIIPAIVHSSLNSPGIIICIKSLNSEELAEFQDFLKGSNYNAILIKNIGSREKIVVLTQNESFKMGDIIELKDSVLEAYVDWHDFNIFNEKYTKITIGDIYKLNGLELSIESMINTLSVVYFLSLFSFITTPILIFIYICKFYKRIFLWNLTGCLSTYSFGFLFSGYLKYIHDVEVDQYQKIFGNLFPIFLISTIIFYKYEKMINWNNIKEYTLDLFEKFSK